ncbi:MAG: cytochrome c oxidase subunit 3 [Myxococcota bacterium]|nr:cytochrome c oxidase subunit 3 [Myxococcota bacterium]MDW8363725.1 cytochrome c oxidase subunit 3 [Myxococcales bacterium]
MSSGTLLAARRVGRKMDGADGVAPDAGVTPGVRGGQGDGGGAGQPADGAAREGSARRPDAVVGMGIFLTTEVMLFAGLLAAYWVLRGRAVVWPPPGLPRLPIAETALQTVLLCVSGLVLAGARGPGSARRLAGAWALGAAFLVLQGREWVALMAHGLTTRSGPYGGTFYTIVGVHALHVLAALMALGWGWLRARRDALRPDALAAVRMFWLFVVCVWPVLYLALYA